MGWVSLCMLIKTINSYGKDNNEGIQPSSMKKDGKLHARNVSITQENNLISNWLKGYGDPAIDKLAKRNLAVANRIADILSRKNIKSADLAKAMGKQHSEIRKWLSGTYSLSTKTIACMEGILGEDIISTNIKT